MAPTRPAANEIYLVCSMVATDGSTRLQMLPDGSTWFQMIPHGPRWPHQTTPTASQSEPKTIPNRSQNDPKLTPKTVSYFCGKTTIRARGESNRVPPGSDLPPSRAPNHYANPALGRRLPQISYAPKNTGLGLAPRIKLSSVHKYTTFGSSGSRISVFLMSLLKIGGFLWDLVKIHGSMGPWIHGSMDPWIHG